MSRLDHDRVTNLLAEAVALPASRRDAFLDSTCLGEAELRRELEELLAYTDCASEAFAAASQRIVEPDPDQIGPYQILEPIGEGGMAIVYKAQQHHPVRRIVAVKLIKLGMDTRQFVARFEAERQALAMMDHPNVAQVYDAGSTETRRPYFVMEYVPGRSILEDCDERNLGIRQRLELFIDVCEAVEHAHRKGIIHRDLKDSNVLVTDIDGRPVPKVIDFGVAKTILQPLTDRTLQTEQGQLIGTPEYMSPEQAERGVLDIDTRSDIYSLGVLLYELISGVQPIPSEVLRAAGYEQVQRIIRDTEPQRPSTRLSTLAGGDATTIAKRRSTALPTLIRELRSELEWIPLKAMRKDREERYRSAAELGDDVRNYLENRPLIAGPESSWYRARKMLRRHKTGVAASATMLLLLIGGIVATAWQAVRATRAEQLALREKQEAEGANASSRAVIHFFTENVVGSADPTIARGREVTVTQALQKATESIDRMSDERPLVKAAIRHALANTYRTLGRSDLARAQIEGALEVRRRILGEDHPDTLDSKQKMILILSDEGRYDEAWELAEKTLDRSRRALGDDHPLTILMFLTAGRTARAVGEYDRAEPLLREAVDRSRRVSEPDNDTALAAIAELGALRLAQGNLTEAEELCREALQRARSTLGNDAPRTLWILSSLGAVLAARGELAEAESVFREALVGMRHVLGEDHLSTLNGASNLAHVLQEAGRLQEAEVLARDALDRFRRMLGSDHPDTLIALNNLAVLLQVQGKLADAEGVMREGLQICRRKLGDDHPNTLAFVQNLAFVLSKQSKYSEAEPLYREVIDRRRRVLGDNHPATLMGLEGFANMLQDSGSPERALPLFEELYARMSAAELDPKTTARYTAFYALCLYNLGQHQEAAAPLRQAYERLTSAGMEKIEIARSVVAALADVCDHTNRTEEAAEWRVKLKDLQSATQPATRPG